MRTTTSGQILFGKTRQGVLALLLLHSEEWFHLRQIVRLTGAGPGPVHRELEKLTAAGVILRERRGRQVFFRAASDSPIFPDLRGLLIKTAGIADLLRQALAPMTPLIRCAFIFGSFAKGNSHGQSDVDLMVVGDVSFKDLAHALVPPQRRLGRAVNPNLYPRNELARKMRSGHHFLRDVLAGPKIFLIGDEHELGAMAQERLASRAQDKRERNHASAGGR